MNNSKSGTQNKRPHNDQNMDPNKRFRAGNEGLEVGILLQNQDLGSVIGKGGANINKIREESGAVVHTSKFVEGTHERTVKIVGSGEQVSTAIKMIIDEVCKDYPMITLLAEYKNCGNLIGKKGIRIKEIREKTGANIHVSKECIGNSTQKEISVKGDYDAVIEAIDAVVKHLGEGNNPTRMAYVPGGVGGITNLAAGFSNPATGGRGWVLPSVGRPLGAGATQREGVSPIRMEMTLWVPKEVIGKIIGRAGATIRTVREQSTAHVFVHKDEENEESAERKITIKGSRKAIDMACTMLEALVIG